MLAIGIDTDTGIGASLVYNEHIHMLHILDCLIFLYLKLQRQEGAKSICAPSLDYACVLYIVPASISSLNSSSFGDRQRQCYM